MIEHAFAVLRQLSDGRFHSGEAIAKTLGCSRTLVWQAVHYIQQTLCLTVFRVRGQGYRLSQPFEWLEVEAIRQNLSKEASEAWRLSIAGQTDSTNKQLLARASQSGLHGMVLAAELQTQGRGRLARCWQSRLGASLTFSILWRFDRSMAELAGLSLAVGVAIANALHRLGVWVALKWPNDVLLHHRKLAGILIELSGDALGPTWTVIGIGLNVQSPGELEPPAASLEDAGCVLNRNALLAVLLNELYPVLITFNHQGFVPFSAQWMRLNAHDNQPVVLSSFRAEPIEGVAKGVTDTGALLLQTDQGLLAFHAGEVSLRGRA